MLCGYDAKQLIKTRRREEMGTKKRTEVKNKQREKRLKRRTSLKKAGKNPDDFFVDGTWVPKP